MTKDMTVANKKTSLLVDLYELAMAASYLEHRKDAAATFELFIRELPKQRSYFIAAGLEDCLHYLEGLHFDDEDISYLRKKGIFKEEFLTYLKDFRFKGNVWALKEGEVFFPNEPVLRVTADLIEAQIVESFLLNTINFQTMVATKASRIVQAARGRRVFDFALRRTHGRDAGIKAARSSYIAGCDGTSNVLAGFLYGIPIVGTMAHSFVMSFDKEVDSFNAFASTFPDTTILLIDTYNTIKGAGNAIKVARILEKKGRRLKAVRLDSGDITSLSKKVRRMLDESGLGYVNIFASGNLDEYKIEGLIKKGAKINSFGVGTNMGTSSDAPYCDVIYKITEITEEGRFLPTMKLSRGKTTYPGRKQVFRIEDKDAKYSKDVLAQENEKITGRPLLVKVIEEGKIIYDLPSLEEIKNLTMRHVSCLPDKYKNLVCSSRYPVEMSLGLKKLTFQLTKELKKRS